MLIFVRIVKILIFKCKVLYVVLSLNLNVKRLSYCIYFAVFVYSNEIGEGYLELIGYCFYIDGAK